MPLPGCDATKTQKPDHTQCYNKKTKSTERFESLIETSKFYEGSAFTEIRSAKRCVIRVAEEPPKCQAAHPAKGEASRFQFCCNKKRKPLFISFPVSKPKHPHPAIFNFVFTPFNNTFLLLLFDFFVCVSCVGLFAATNTTRSRFWPPPVVP
eukprot:TRINITY_DN11480_c0_g1_i1.p2 TRINITY_DN11480_c0_g1~~TRINITY_DN11480_c0_g1_i1.p2  ORF type:complete len:152 (-),score=18.07 TRINITY_DN11480_c0_g1_i1:432-887(-)